VTGHRWGKGIRQPDKISENFNNFGRVFIIIRGRKEEGFCRGARKKRCGIDEYDDVWVWSIMVVNW
jgi:hypothetical protein